MTACKDCTAEGASNARPSPYPGPRCATHHRTIVKARKGVAHERRVRRVFGLAEGDYDRLYAYQGGLCAGCRRANGATKKLAVDHHHVTGEVRGLLCGPCNRMVGHFRDDPATFERLAAYLVLPPFRQMQGRL